MSLSRIEQLARKHKLLPGDVKKMFAAYNNVGEGPESSLKMVMGRKSKARKLRATRALRNIQALPNKPKPTQGDFGDLLGV